MPQVDDTAIAEVNALSASHAGAARVGSPLQAEATAHLHQIRPQAPPDAQPKSYLDQALGVVIKNDKWERNVAEAAKTGAMFFGGRVGLATTVVLYALDQVKVGDSFGQAVTDAGLGAAKGSVMRGVYAFSAARDFGIAGQALTLGTGSRVLDAGLNRQTWTDSRTNSFSLEQGKKTMVQTALDRPALLADLGSFALGGMMSGAVNRFTENSLRSNPFWRTTLTGGAFGLATGSTSEIRRERESGEKFDLTKIIAAGGTQAAFSALAVAPSGAQADYKLTQGFLDPFGVNTIGAKGSYHYSYTADGKVNELFSTPASPKGLKEAQSRLTEISEQRQVGLAKTFGISFARPGEPIYYEGDNGTVHLKARAPRLNELVAVEQAVAKSQPGQLSLDGKPGVKFNFMQDRDSLNANFGGAFEYHGDEPNIYLHSELLQKKPMTDRDQDTVRKMDGGRRKSLESTAEHEVAHNTNLKVRAIDPALEDSIRDQLGWVRYREDSARETNTHLLKAKDGGLYRFSEDSGWVKSDPQGNAVDMQGNRAQAGAEVTVTNEQMMERSLVPPVTDYFQNPSEMLVEGFMRFRNGGDNRAKLLIKSPILYEQVLRQDNRELGLHYGTDTSGQSLMVRLPDGTLAQRNAQSEGAISQFERTSLAARDKSKAGDASLVSSLQGARAGVWEDFMTRFKHSQGHATNCGQMSVMHDLAARPELRQIMREAVVRNGDGTYSVRFFDPNLNDQPVSVSVTRKEVREPTGYFLKSDQTRIKVLDVQGASVIAEDPSNPGQTIAYEQSDVGKLRGMRQPPGHQGDISDQQIIERAYGRFLQEQKPTRYQNIPGRDPIALTYRQSVDDHHALNLVRAWDFAGDLTGIRQFKTILTGQMDGETLAGLSTKLADHAIVYEPEVNHVKQVTSQSVPEPHSHDFHGGHTYAVLDINPDQKTLTLLSSLQGQEPLTVRFDELVAGDEDGALNVIRVVKPAIATSAPVASPAVRG